MRIFTFDSGVGGLSVLGSLFQQLPAAQVLYLGDIANLPYGTKSSERVRELTLKNLEWLLSQENPQPEKGDFCLIACNTASAEALQYCREKLGTRLPIVGVIEASCRAAIASGRDTITVLATPATVRSAAYEKTLRELGFTGKILQIPCPLFVPLVEEGILEGPAVDWIIERYLKSKVGANDCIVLGCTHYPYLQSALKKHYPNASYVHAGQALCGFDATFKERAQRESSGKGALDIYVTDSTVKKEQISFYLQKLGIDKVAWSHNQTK